MVTLSSFMLTLVGLVGKLSLEELAVEASDVADATHLGHSASQARVLLSFLFCIPLR